MTHQQTPSSVRFSDMFLSSARNVLHADAVNEPGSVPGDAFRVALQHQGSPLGWLGENDKGWAVVVAEPAQAVVLEQYPHNGRTYLRIRGSARYLSVSLQSSLGFYNWANASGFRLQGERLVSDYNGQAVSIVSTDDGYLYANDAQTVLDVQWVAWHRPVVADPPLTSLIEHVVVVMLENRSFDNMLGGLYPEKTRSGEYRGLRGDESNPVGPCGDAPEQVTVFQGPADASTWIMPYPDPGELFDDMNEQIFGQCTSDMARGVSGFARNYARQPGAPLYHGGPNVEPEPRNVMQYYSTDAVPMTSFLATQYAVCDGWHASGPVQTLANRVFAHCGTPGRVPGTNDARINNPDFIKDWSLLPPFDPPVTEKTVFQLLDEAYPGETNWKVYYHDAPVSALCRYVYQHWKWLSWDGGNVFQFASNFEYDIQHGRLPKYSFIEPRYTNTFGDGPANSAHPGGAGIDLSDPNGSSLPPPISVMDGEKLLKQIYETLSRYPETFRKTLLIVIYDEHGGLYDHVMPPTAVSPFEGKVDNFAYDRFGVRIPAMLINPAIPPGTIYPPRDVATEWQIDHTSLISTICAQFGLQGSLSPRASAASVLSRLIPDAPQAHARPAPPSLPEDDGVRAYVEQMRAAASTEALDGQPAPSAPAQPHALGQVLKRLLPLAQTQRDNRNA